MITPEEQAEIAAAAEVCGAEILECISTRPTGRARDIADLGFAYHQALTMLLRDSQITDEERLATLGVVDLVTRAANAKAESVLDKHGRLREVDA